MEQNFEHVLKNLSENSKIYQKIYILTKLKEFLPLCVPENLSNHVIIKNYQMKERILELSCSNNYVKQEILFRERSLIEKINKIYGIEIVKKIKLVP